MANKVTRTTDEYVNLATKTHNNKYDYSLVEYTKGANKIVIICPIHGTFEQLAYKHLQGLGCNKCGRIEQARKRLKTQEMFVRQANNTHDSFFDYTNTVYVRDNAKVIINCPKHGNFKQRPSDHLRGNGCPKCSKRISKGERLWLDSLCVPDGHDYRQVSFIIEEKTVRVDGYIPETNTVYEFWGDYWHGNPKKYNPDDINPTNKIPYGKLYDDTLTKIQLLHEAGFKVIDIWESEWKLIQNGIHQAE